MRSGELGRLELLQYMWWRRWQITLDAVAAGGGDLNDAMELASAAIEKIEKILRCGKLTALTVSGDAVLFLLTGNDHSPRQTGTHVRKVVEARGVFCSSDSKHSQPPPAAAADPGGGGGGDGVGIAPAAAAAAAAALQLPEGYADQWMVCAILATGAQLTTQLHGGLGAEAYQLVQATLPLALGRLGSLYMAAQPIALRLAPPPPPPPPPAGEEADKQQQQQQQQQDQGQVPAPAAGASAAASVVEEEEEYSLQVEGEGTPAERVSQPGCISACYLTWLASHTRHTRHNRKTHTQ